MNSGAHLVLPLFPEFDRINKVFSQVRQQDWMAMLPDGPYKTDGWRVVKIVDNGELTDFAKQHPDLERALSYFQCKIVMAVYYSMLPGSELHAHRDLTGTLEFGRLRFHVPVITNPSVNFYVSNKRVPMKVGELWALNTSYLHAVENHGAADRIHLVLEVESNEWCWSLLPAKTAAYYFHFAWFVSLIAWGGTVKTLKNPMALKRYAFMVRFLGAQLKRKIQKPK